MTLTPPPFDIDPPRALAAAPCLARSLGVVDAGGKSEDKRVVRCARAVVVNAVAVAVAVALSVLAPCPAFAQPATETAIGRQDLDLDAARAFDGCTLDAVLLEGLHRTHDKVVLRELTTKLQAPLRHHDLRESVRRLRNLWIFRRVDVQITRSVDDASQCLLTLHFDEKWTLLPVFSIGRGGAITFLTLGAQDNHVAGRLLEASLLWQLFDGASLLRRNRGRFGADGQPLAGWSRHRWQFGIDAADLRVPGRTMRASLWWIDDRFDTALLPGKVAAEAVALGVPARRRWLSLGLGGTLGRIDHAEYLERGATLNLSLLGGVEPGFVVAPGADAAKPWLRGVLTAHGAWLPIGRLNLVGQISVGAMNRAVEEVGLYVGGLDGVRGLPDSRYLGAVMVVANAEARLPSWVSTWLVVQHVAFVDVGHAASSVGTLFEPAVPWSVGGGLRLIVPRLARLVARIDVAWAHEQRSGWLISFGGQQAF
jgi:hypothetical protein